MWQRVGGWCVMRISTSHSGVLGERANRHSVHYVTLRKAWWMRAFYLLVLQWIGSSCFVSQQKAEIISRILMNKIHVTILIILLFCFFSFLFCWKAWEAQYRLLHPTPPERRQVRWDMKNLSLKLTFGLSAKLLSRRREKNAVNFHSNRVGEYARVSECDSLVWSLPIAWCRWLVTDGFLVCFKWCCAPFP